MTEVGGTMCLISHTPKSRISVLWPLDLAATTGKAQPVKTVRSVLGWLLWLLLAQQSNLAKGPGFS